VSKVLLVIPFFSGDRGMVERLGKWMSALSGGQRIGARVLFSATVQTDIKGIGDNFKGLFDEIKGIRQTFGPNLAHGENPWPKACNLQFLHTAKHVYDHYHDIDAFYYFEPDNVPLTRDWFERICADYQKQGKPFYGVSASYIERREGVDAFLNGEHMIGTGIYPRDAYARIKAYAEIEREQPGRPWDAITRDEVNPQCHFTKLICNANGSRGFMEEAGKVTAIFKPNLEKRFERRAVDLGDAVIFHGCKDSSLRLLVAQKLGIPQNDVLTFAHAGDFGDIIYALASIKARGGGILKLDTKPYTREQMTESRARLIIPLLLEQDYLDDVRIHDGGYVDFDFSPYRHLHESHSNIAKDQANWIGVEPDFSKPWLTVPDALPTGKVIVNRTARYHNNAFPWRTVYSELGSALRFIGLAAEHRAFESEFGDVAALPTPTLLDAAREIAGSDLFIGNQSACFAIAEGLKHPRIQETCPENRDCVFGGRDAQYCDTESLILGPSLKAEKPKFPMHPWHVDPKLIFECPEFDAAVNRIVEAKMEALLK
jgi:hypothetical protein